LYSGIMYYSQRLLSAKRGGHCGGKEICKRLSQSID